VFRLLALLAGLAGAGDLGTGSAPDESLHRCLVATRLARLVATGDDAARLEHDTRLASLLTHVGCTAYSYEAARTWGDDVAVTRAALLTDATSAREAVRTFLPEVAAGTGRSRPAAALLMARSMRAMARDAPVATCEVARHAADRLGLGAGVADALGHLTATWDGSGHPATSGTAIPLATRVMQVAAVAMSAWETGGPAAACAAVRRRAGGELDPGLVETFETHAPSLLAGLDAADPFDLVLDDEPDPVAWVDEDRLVAIARVCGDLADLKSPWLHGHSAAVGDLAGAAAESLGLPEATAVRAAGHLHDVGRVGLPGRLWALPRPWTVAERDQARLHAHHTERVLARVPQLADVAALASAHHERCDGSGYHRGLRADRLPTGARVLAAADAWRTAVEDRPHRPGLGAEAARHRLQAEVAAGRLDGDAVTAVVAAACGEVGRRRPTGAVGLTPRQLEVLRLVTRGLSNREIARRLGISSRTVDRHVADVYTRIGVGSRAAAALFTIEHGLTGPEPAPDG
jgi:HD-GYP domain-containing protein (c-di-GMP phosphodiesterase class II)/DNA-binding CsgD family transcriptional regulator